MVEFQLYYYEDVVFQLELNLQYIRREIVKLLEEHKFNDCFACNKLRCCCCGSQSTLRSTTLSADSDLQDIISMRSFYSAAPPADSLPTPEWKAHTTGNVSSDSNEELVSIAAINTWIRASIPNLVTSNTRLYFPVPTKILDQLNFSWPPFPKSIWSNERLKETIERENLFGDVRERFGNNSVAAFFKYFGGNTLIPRSAIY